MGAFFTKLANWFWEPGGGLRVIRLVSVYGTTAPSFGVLVESFPVPGGGGLGPASESRKCFIACIFLTSSNTMPYKSRAFMALRS